MKETPRSISTRGDLTPPGRGPLAMSAVAGLQHTGRARRACSTVPGLCSDGYVRLLMPMSGRDLAADQTVQEGLSSQRSTMRSWSTVRRHPNMQ
jgi:hypothetical protein